ncbi:MAG: DUF5723 family protein [Bacteroidota bacterium]|nr:DUF5723 family protein [Bacteroidota bacterium]
MEQAFLKAGLTVKRLGGIYSAHFINKEATYKILEDLEHPDEQNIYIDQLKANYGYVQDYDNRNLYQVHNWITGSRMPGNGFGMDAGIVYESRPTSRYYTYQMDGRTYKDNTFNKYNYRIGIAIIDLCGIRYKGDHVKSYNVATQNIDFKINDFDGANNADEINDTIEEILGPQIVKTKFKSGLPTALNLNIDVKLLYNMYVSMVWMPGLRSNSSINMRHNSFVAIVPRYEKKHVELSLPISLSENYHNFSTGAMLRVGQVFVGSDNIAGLLNIGNPHGLNLYSGLTIPISNKKLKDSDLDGVSDKKDKCPYEKGIARFEGCPDLDQDGIPDYLDNCPEAFGTKSNAGCPVLKQVNGYKEILLSIDESKIIKDVYDNVEFETGKASLSSSSSASLAKLADLLLKRPGYKLLIEGHTDNTGLAESNMILSLDRANSFRDFLINKGVNPEILIANGYGSERPIADNNNDKGRKLNRRVECKFIP